MRSRFNTANRLNTRSRINTANWINTRSRINTVRRFNMLSRIVDTQRIGCGVGSGIVNIPNRFTIHGPITIRTTGTLAGITAVVDAPSVDIAAVVTPAGVTPAGVTPVVVTPVVVTPVVVTPVVVTVAIRNGGTVRISPRQSFIACRLNLDSA
jgi:hypothetical protein